MTVAAPVAGGKPVEPVTRPQIVCDGLMRIYKRKGVEVVALQGLNLRVGHGELLAIVGASGSGKSTLLNVLSGLDAPTAGHAEVSGHDLLAMGRRQRRRYRLKTCGFVWQHSARNLVPYLTATENIDLPQRLARRRRAERGKRSTELMEQLGITECYRQRPVQLSGGQQQRLAIAVALANSPQVLFCDEPTGELDSTSAREVYTALREVNETTGTTIVVVTHDPSVADEVSRTVAIRDGRTATETLREAGLGGDGHADRVAQEYAVLDRVGRLQLPRDFVDSLRLEHRVRLELEQDHIEVWPPDERHRQPTPPTVVPSDSAGER